MSPFYRRDCVALHFTWRYDWEGVKLGNWFQSPLIWAAVQANKPVWQKAAA